MKLLCSLVSVFLLLSGQVTSQQSPESSSCFKTCPGLSDESPAVCCYQIFRCNSLSPSGYYWIRNNGTVQATHCEMDLVKITSITPGSSEDYPADSCFDVYDCDPYTKNGNYWIKSSSHPRQVNCNITAISSPGNISKPVLVYLMNLLQFAVTRSLDVTLSVLLDTTGSGIVEQSKQLTVKWTS